MKLIGLTGGIASGKSTATQLIREYGVPVIDADTIAREVVAPGKPANKKIREAFGESVFLADETLDRPKLGEIIFNDPAKRKILNQCTHPYVRKEMLRQAFVYWLKGTDRVVFDVPLLLESHLDKYMGTTVLVYW
ncbi:dephospho-CoA kinase domain-containing protein [Spinellus fusiger]|nr:dephospho-CoA kinase domain-containing protein [Spinellus fusiger]